MKPRSTFRKLRARLEDQTEFADDHLTMTNAEVESALLSGPSSVTCSPLLGCPTTLAEALELVGYGGTIFVMPGWYETF